MKQSRVATTIKLDGPFFSHDPRKTFRQNTRVLMDAIAKEGQGDVRAQLQAGESGRWPISAGVSPSRVSQHVIGRTKSLRGKRWAVTAVVSVNNSGLTREQGVALMAAASRLERIIHAFRKTASRMRRAKAINRAELLKGLL